VTSGEKRGEGAAAAIVASQEIEDMRVSFGTSSDTFDVRRVGGANIRGCFCEVIENTRDAEKECACIAKHRELKTF
jgi:hypothetical protein